MEDQRNLLREPGVTWLGEVADIATTPTIPQARSEMPTAIFNPCAAAICVPRVNIGKVAPIPVITIAICSPWTVAPSGTAESA